MHSIYKTAVFFYVSFIYFPTVCLCENCWHINVGVIRWSIEDEKRPKVHHQPSSAERGILHFKVTCDSHSSTHCNRNGSLRCFNVLLICQQVNAIEMITAIKFFCSAPRTNEIEIEFRSCSAGIDSSVSNGAANKVDSSQLQAAGFVSGQPSSMTSKSPSTTAGLTTMTPTTEAPNGISSRAIEFHEGWTPTLYT